MPRSPQDKKPTPVKPVAKPAVSTPGQASVDSHTEWKSGAAGGPIRCDRVSGSPDNLTETLSFSDALQDSESCSSGTTLFHSLCVRPSGSVRKNEFSAITTRSYLQADGNPVTGKTGGGEGAGEAVESLAARRRRIAEEKEAARMTAARAARPDGVNAMGHTPEDERALGLAVLQKARALAQGQRLSLLEALGEAGEGITYAYALRLFARAHREPAGTWGMRRHTPREAMAALDFAIRDAGGTPPTGKRPGPKVSTQPPSAEEVERRRALFAAAGGFPPKK